MLYNLMELVWHSAKEYIANQLFKSLDELESLIHKLLNEGELTIHWGRKIKLNRLLRQELQF